MWDGVICKVFGLVGGIIHEIKERSTARTFVLVLGIDGAGKSTLVDALMCHKDPERKPRTIRPTNGLQPQTIEDGKTFVTFWDISGNKEFRGSIWNDYLKDANVVLYVVNGEQTRRVHESRKVFDDVSLRFSNQLGIVFLNADRQILQIFPSASQAERMFFTDIKSPESLEEVYQWLKSTAVKGRREE